MSGDHVWLVVFSDPEPLAADASFRDRLLYAALRLLKPGFRHCFALRRAHGFAGWVMVNWSAAALDVLEFVGDDYAEAIIQGAKAGHNRCLFVRSVRPGRWTPRLGLPCVSMVKHLLGVRAPLAVTPHQFWLHLAGRVRTAPLSTPAGPEPLIPIAPAEEDSHS